MKSLYFLKKCKGQKSQKKPKGQFLIEGTAGTGGLNDIHDPGLDPEPERKRNTDGTAGETGCISVKEYR